LHTNKASLPIPEAVAEIPPAKRVGSGSASAPRRSASGCGLVPSLSFSVEFALAVEFSIGFHFAVANGFMRDNLASALPPAACDSSISNRLTSLKSVEIVVCIQMKFGRERPIRRNDNDRRRATTGE
jgi:hypothetical protein